MTPIADLALRLIWRTQKCDPLSQIWLFGSSGGLKSVTPIADSPLQWIRGLKSVTPITDSALQWIRMKSVWLKSVTPIARFGWSTDPYKSVWLINGSGWLKSVTPIADPAPRLIWRTRKCDPYRRFGSSADLEDSKV